MDFIVLLVLHNLEILGSQLKVDERTRPLYLLYRLSTFLMVSSCSHFRRSADGFKLPAAERQNPFVMDKLLPKKL